MDISVSERDAHWLISTIWMMEMDISVSERDAHWLICAMRMLEIEIYISQRRWISQSVSVMPTG